ncbi:MAG TPA: protein kinase [Polyangiaceae bacterium]|nr:protein kinase [Polyangiaceae bacterium]
MTDLRAGERFGPYELLFPVATGSQAQVWAARLRGKRGTQKTVAIKTISPSSVEDSCMGRPFLEEARFASQIHHPNVVGTLELGEHDGNPYVVMEWVEGESLNYIMTRAIDGGGVPLPIAVNLIGQACKGLHAAHELCDESGSLLGLVHRDISAQNVLVTYAGCAKVVDFGIGNARARATGWTEEGELRGKFAYMAPEQINALPLDRRADIFSMGVLLYLITTGRHPFRGSNAAETLRNIRLKEPVPPSSFAVGYSPELESVVLKALERSPEDRWGSADELQKALEQATPRCFARGFEARVATYLQGLLGSRASERRARLIEAHQALKLLRPDEPEGPGGSHRQPSSLGSLRGIAVDRSEGDAPSVAPRPRVVIEYAATSPSAKAAPFVTAARRAGWIGALAVVGALLVSIVAKRSPDKAPRSAAVQAPLVTLTARLPQAAVAPLVAASAARPLVAASAVAGATIASVPHVEVKDAGSKRAPRGALPSRPSVVRRAPLAPATRVEARTAPAASASRPERPLQEGRDQSSGVVADPNEQCEDSMGFAVPCEPKEDAGR